MINNLYILILGLCFGSFLNVVIYRLPEKKSLIFPNSFCPKCRKPIRWFDNIPLLSFLFLGGRCRNCKQNISFQYPLNEIIFSLLVSSFFFFKGPTILEIIIIFLFTGFLYSISCIDLKTLKIPNKLNLYFYIFGVIANLLRLFFTNSQFDRFVLNSFISPLIIFLIFEIFRSLVKLFFKKDGFGGGDSKLISVITVWFGLKGALITVLISFYLGGFFVLFGILLRKVKRNSKIAFGPFLCLSAYLVNFIGIENIISFLKIIYF